MKAKLKRDLTNKRFTDWFVLSFAERSNKGVIKYKVKCKCGYVGIVSGPDLERKKSKRCKSCAVKYRYSKKPNMLVGNKSPAWKGYKDIPRAIFTKCKYGAKKRNIVFEVTIEDLQEIWEKQKEKCIYSNRVLFFNNKSFSTKDKKDQMFDFASLDRRDSSKGYIKGNIQWVAQSVNLAKHAYSEEEFLKLIRDIYLNRLKT